MLFNKLFTSQEFVFDLFLKDQILPILSPRVLNSINTNGFSVSQKKELEKNNSIIIIKDIPSYLDINLSPTIPSKKYESLSTTQYNGFLVNLNDINNIDTYLKTKLSKRNIKNLFSKHRKLTQNYAISEKIYFGQEKIAEIDSVFDVFAKLLKERFKEKQINNRYLNNWEQVKEISIARIAQKKASLHVIYSKNQPITITLNFHNGDIVFSHIHAYDINFSKFNMGDIAMYNQIKWCIENNYNIFDMAIGKTPYKEKWCNYEYTYSYRICYKNQSFLSKILAKYLWLEFECISYLRSKGLIGSAINLDKIIFKIKSLKLK